jgi:GT2 family glycosyltransferase
MLKDVVVPTALYHLTVAEALEAGTLASPFMAWLWHEGRPIASTKLVDGHGVCDIASWASQQAVAPATGSPAAVPHTVSVIICTRDRPEQLDRCLATLAGQTFQPHEVLVVDNASSTTETAEVVSRHGHIYLREDRAGLSHARNTGIAAASGDIVAFTDDDTVLHPDWLLRLEAAFDTDHVWAATGLVIPAELRTEAQCIFELGWSFGHGFVRKDYDASYYQKTRMRGTPTWEFGAGASMAFRRDIFNKIGLFDPHLGAGASGCSEDSEIWYRILRAGGLCRYEPASVLYHFHRADMAGLQKQIRAYMRGHVVALWIQYRKSSDIGNLRRLLISLPRYYLRKVCRRVLHGITVPTCTLGDEIAGYFSGLHHIVKNHRSL